MRTILFLHNAFFVFAILVSSNHGTSVTAGKAMDQSSKAGSAVPALSVTLNAANHATIFFKAENGKKITASISPGRNIPRLVLSRNGVLTPGFERTIHLFVKNIEVPRAGLYAHLVIETQHSNPDIGRKNTSKIQLWDETRFIPYPVKSQSLISMDFNMTFQGLLKAQQKWIQTPTDYYSYQLTLLDQQGNILQETHEEYAFLLENQWRIPLPRVWEASPHAAPNKLLIYYYDMIPFQSNARDPETRIPRQAVGRYIQTELIPAMVDAFKTQTDLWGFPWYTEWSNYRTEEDRKTLSVALGDDDTWFHGAAPALGYSTISIRVDGGFTAYSNITDGIMSIFHHELFHNQQRNIQFHFGNKGNLAGKNEAWQLFTEGTAVLASSVGQPTIQFEPTAKMRSYFSRANAFLGAEGFVGGDLNKNYPDNPYNFAIYWRFLYESCGGIQNETEDPATGMKVIRHVLESLYKGEIVNINESTDVTAALPRIIDAALQATPTCAFHSYDESLIHFARAIYLLRLEEGRCPTSDRSTDCGFYDLHQLYSRPPVEAHIIQANSTSQINGTISTSYGIDLIELTLDPSAQGKTLKLIFKGNSGPSHEFNVELWDVKTLPHGSGSEEHSAQRGEPESMRTEYGNLTMEIGNLDPNEFNRLGLIITRLDDVEKTDTSGNYRIQILVE